MSHLNAGGILICGHHYRIDKDSIELPITLRPSSAVNTHLSLAVLDGEDLERSYPFVQVIIREARLKAS